MNLRLTGFLALVAALLALLIAFWDRDDEAARARLDQARRAFRFDASRVDHLRIESGDLVVECRLANGQWRLARPISARADAVAIERLLGALQELPRGDIILPPRRSPDPFGPYGLDDPRARITLVEGAVTNQILIGRRTPLGDGVYVRQTEHAGLARLHAALLDLLPASAEALRDRSLLAGVPAAIDRFDIRSPAGYIQLVRDPGGTWRIFQPFTARADSASVMALVETLLSCTVVHFIQDGVSDLAPYGLDSQGAVTAVLNIETGEGSQMLAFGDPLPNATNLVYARLQAENSVYAVPLQVRDALQVRPDDLRDRRLPGLDPDTIGRVLVEEGESRLEFFRDDMGAWQLAAPLRAPADGEAIEALLRSWSDVRMVAFETQPPPDAPPLVRLLRIESRDPRTPPVVLRLGPHPQNNQQVRLEIEGDSTVAAATPSKMLDFPLDPLLYRSREVLFVSLDDLAEIHVATPSQSVRFARDAISNRWSPDSPWLGRLLPLLAPLRAERLLAPGASADMGLDKPHLTLSTQLRGQSGLATTLLVGNELAPGGPRWARIRGRDLVFALAPETVAALAPPAPTVPQ
jgi:hypothetical protein